MSKRKMANKRPLEISNPNSLEIRKWRNHKRAKLQDTETRRRETDHTDAGRGGTPSGCTKACSAWTCLQKYSCISQELYCTKYQEERHNNDSGKQSQRVRYRKIFLIIFGIIMGKKKLISEGSGTILKSRKSRVHTLVNQNKY